LSRAPRRPGFWCHNMREIRPDQHEVTRAQRRDVITHPPVPVALQHQRELILRMKMPHRVIARSPDDFAMEGFPLRASQNSFVENFAHNLIRKLSKSRRGWRRKLPNRYRI
jgi:hypothetical protein